MSDDKAGDASPERPEQNVGALHDQSVDKTDDAGTRKRRKNRRRRKKRTSNGVQADMAGASSGQSNADTRVATEAHAPAPSDPIPQASNGNGVDALDQPRRNKRSRRRRRRGKKQAEHSAPAAVETGPGVNARDRNRRKAEGDGNSDDANRAAEPRSGLQQQQSHGSANARTRRPTNAYAALDLGTNNCRLLVAIPQQPGRFKVIDAFSRIVRLGEGLAASGRLSDPAMDRAVEALKACATKLGNRKVKGVRLIATEACRRAENGEAFLNRVRDEAGLDLEIVDRETEAKLAVAGCCSLVDRRASGAVLFDIGGGSSELALLDLRNRHKFDLSKNVVSWTSLPMGVVTLSEKHGGGELVTRGIFNDMVDEVIDHLNGFDGRNALDEAAGSGEIHLLGTSGTVTTLAGIHLKLPRYDRRRVDGTWMAAAEVDAMIEELLTMSFEQRVDNPCIGRNRADLVLAGCAILVAIQKLWPCPRLRVADRGLREGLLTQMMNADNAWQRRPNRFRNRSK